MSTSHVTSGTPGRHRHLPQRVHEDRPLTNCTGFALSMCLEFGGLRITDVRRFIARGRTLTGIPEVNAKGQTQGTSVADWQRAFAQMIPWVEVRTGWVEQEALLVDLRGGVLAAAAGVSYPALPTRQRRWSPRFTGAHRVTLIGARKRDGEWQVLMDDPLGMGDYTGDWMAWADLRKAMAANGQVSGSRVWVATVTRGAAVSTLIRPVETYAPPASVAVPKGINTWTVDTGAGRLVAGKPTPSKHVAGVVARSNVRNYPDGSPNGSFVQLIGGPCDGAWVRSGDVTITPATVPDDCSVRVEAARREGYDAAVAEYEPVDGQAYTRTAA